MDALKNNIQKIKVIYETVVNRLIEPSYSVSNGYAVQKTLATFLERFSGQYGGVTDERIVDYCVFTAHRYRNSPSVRQIKQMFGPTALQQYVKSSSIDRFYENKWLSSGDLSRNKLVQSIAIKQHHHPHAKYLYMAAEEQTKLRMHNKPVGFVLCQSSTLGWSPLSNACVSCVYIKDCKTLTLQKYPEIYRLREAYEQNNN